MNCPNCKVEIDGQAVFCPECGWNLMESVSTTTQANESVQEEVAEVKSEAIAAEAEVGSVVTATPEEDVFLNEKVTAPEPVVYAPIMAAPVQAATPAPAYTATQVTGDTGVQTAKAPDKVVVPKEYKPFSTIGAMGFLLLTSIPVIGFISLLVYAFGGKNKNRKSVARAILIWGLIGLVILAAAAVVAILLFGLENIQDLIGGLVYAESAEEVLDALAVFGDTL